MTRTKKLIQNSIIFTLGNIGSKLITFIMVPLYTYIFSKSEYGEIDVLITTVNLFLPIITLSIFDSVFRFSMDKKENKSAILSSGLMVTVILSLVAIIFIPLLSFWHIRFGIYFTLILIIMSIFTLIQNFARAIGHSKVYATAGIINGLTFAILNIIFLFILKLGIKGYFISYVISLFVAIIYISLMIKIWNYIDVRSFSIENTIKMLKYSIPLIPNSLAWWLTNDASRFFILAYVGVTGNGIFAVANKIPSLLNMMFNIFTQAWQISAVEEYDSSDSDSYYSSIFNTLMSYLFLIVGCILIIIKPLLNTVVSSNYTDVWEYVPVLLFSATFSNLSGFLGTVFLAAKKTTGLFTTTGIGMIVNVLFSWILTSKIGIIGTSLGGAIGFLVVMIIRLHTIKKYIYVKIDWKKFLFSLTGTIMMSCGIYLSGLNEELVLLIGLTILIVTNFSIFKLVYKLLSQFIERLNKSK